METTYGLGLDPTPYISLAFGLGAAGLLGFAGWIAHERRHLRRLMVALRQPARRPGSKPPNSI